MCTLIISPCLWGLDSHFVFLVGYIVHCSRHTSAVSAKSCQEMSAISTAIKGLLTLIGSFGCTLSHHNKVSVHHDDGRVELHPASALLLPALFFLHWRSWQLLWCIGHIWSYIGTILGISFTDLCNFSRYILIISLTHLGHTLNWPGHMVILSRKGHQPKSFFFI